MGTKNGSLEMQLFRRVTIDLGTGCWLWGGFIRTDGYGEHGASYAHRLSYEVFVGGISPGLEIDHLCRVRHCIRPAHLELVDRRTNTLRGTGFAAKKAAQTHCLRGHPLSGHNLMSYESGHRRCRTCAYAQSKARQQAK